LREIPSYVNYVFLSFGKPDLTYVAGSYDISGTGINVPYDGCMLKESVSALKDKGVEVILSIGGETYWGDPNVYANINYQQIKDLVDDMGFIGIDWDYEPNGSFANIGNAANTQYFIDFINNSRALMPSADGYIIACAPSGVGALGGQVNDDITSPFKFANRNTLTGETDANLYQGTLVTNGINLFGFGATGHMIPVFQSVGNKIDIVDFQGYNAGASTNREIMYDAFAHYAEIYGFTVAAGVHFPDEPWGPYYTYTHANVASLSHHIRDYPTRVGDNDGIMIWQLLMTGPTSSAYSYLNIASQVLNGAKEAAAILDANNFAMSPYTGGSAGCSMPGGGGSGTLHCGYAAYDIANNYATANTLVYHDCKIWSNQWYANAGEEPGVNGVWIESS
jgi:chitinase